MPDSRRPLRRRRALAAEHFFVVLVAVACGLAGAAGAVVFRALIHGMGELFLGAGELFGSPADALRAALDLRGAEPMAPGEELPPWRRLIAPALGGALVGPLVHWVAREARGHGVPEVMEAVARRGGMIRPRVVAIKALASALTIGSGGSVGREGPIVQIGAALGSTIGQLLGVPARQLRTLVGCGAAAGIAATFNAPIAGALFAVEVILADFAAAQLAPIVVASVVATVVSRALLGDYPAFFAPPYELVSPWELGAYALAGVFAALVGLAFIASLSACEDAFERVPLPAPAKASLGGLAVGAIGVWLPHVFGSGYGTITAALEGDLGFSLLGLLLVAKLAATSLTLGSGGSGGVFAPSLFIGAVAGGLFGTVVHGLFPDSTGSSGAYALVTMGAVVAATTHAPIMAIILIFEMTQSIAIIPPLMAACVVSTIVAGFLRRETIYTAKLLRSGVDLQAEQDPNVGRALFVRDVMDRDPERVPAGASFREVLDLVVRSRHSTFFAVDEKGALRGAIPVSALRRLLAEQEALHPVVVAADLVEPPGHTLTEDDDLDLALQVLSESDVAELAVVDARDSRRLVGTLTEHDVLAAYHGEMLRRDLAGGVTARVGLARRGRAVALGGGYLLAEVEAPPRFVGRTLRELDVRRRHGVQVILLRCAGRDEEVRVPDGDDRLAAGDVLVVAGPTAAIEEMGADEPSPP
jgi:CIC family chloride channel protein